MIKIICVGKIKENYLNDLINDYKTRINKYHKIEIVEIKDTNINEESDKILSILNNKDFNICLDIRGNSIDSVELSNLIQNTFNNGYGNICFIIGGSNGVTDEVKSFCNYKLSFSKMTFPHGLFRGVLLEQIYRSFKIINNESYHK